MMAAGKSTLGRIIAKKYNLEFIDTDSNIIKKNEMSVMEIFEKKGEDFFRAQEKKEVLKTLKKSNCIIAVGGGAFLDKTVRESILESAISFWLDVDIELLNKRTKGNNKRPLLNKNTNYAKLKMLYSERKNIYKQADHKIECDKLSKNKIIEKITSIYEKY